VLSFSPRLSISQAVTRLKWLSARALFGEFPDLRRRLFGGQLWSEATFARREGGYFVRTVGESLTGATIRRYIERHQADDAAEDQDEQSAGQLDLF
jgi:putative transposase